MDSTTAATLGAVAGLALGLGALGAAAVRLSDRAGRHDAEVAPASDLPPGVSEVLAVLRSSGVVVDSSDRVVNNSPAAVAHGLVRGQELVHPELVQMARAVRRDGVIREAEFELRKGLGDARFVVAARVAPLGAHHVLLLVEDHSDVRRIEQVRRDFLENVSHELKTPVGGIALLAEAVLNASDDPEAVARFAQRMSVESKRLTQLVREIVELSRLQGADAITEPVLVDVGTCATEAAERCRLLAEEHDIAVVVHTEPGCRIWGDVELVTTAVTNLVGNAIAYSERGTRVGVSVRRAPDGPVEVAVTDQGVGIEPDEQERIFERFYRVDAARSRRTGGTGLGLAIVKHVAENHGGRVTVWSEPGRGSTFTIRLPGAVQPTDARGGSSKAAPDADARPDPAASPDPAVNS
ncbi:MAG TPA: ATP-binding protein [Intrasporangium sp.]|uniref:sensor histidine kinase n=1 Tax=Intrasporangium sp. TaxID=1925024 RepID=UPI002D7956CD|nr:ATP-binding protein [Intrasporangium sp.]HET7397617.1 ATP-binding protein [Intrasporangium sp.]